MAFNVEPKHISLAKKAFENKTRSKEVREMLTSNGLDKNQANSCIRSARKQMKIYKPLKKMIKEQAKREAEQQSNKKTEVKQD